MRNKNKKKDVAKKAETLKTQGRKRLAIARGRGTKVKESFRPANFLKNAAAFLVSDDSSKLKLEKLWAAKEDWSKQLLQPRLGGTTRVMREATSPAPANNVVGVGIGEQIQGGKHTGTLALKFFVRVKYGEDQLTESDRLPDSVGGLPTDVEEVGTFRAFQVQDPRKMIRPGPPGCSVGFADANGQVAMAGTFGALVKRGTRRFILSNNHVLANENKLPIGALTFQPGFLDAGAPPNTSPIGKLSAFVELRTSGENDVDCAISEIADLTLVTNSILKIGVPKGTTTAQSNMIVHKFGRTTGYSVGFVQMTTMDVQVDYGIGTLTFRDQIIVKGLNGQAFSSDGDSGAAVVERNTSRVIGLLFAGSATHTIANHIGAVLQSLNVTLS